jgi:hypothetical protein
MFHKEFGINRARKTREKTATKLQESALEHASLTSSETCSSATNKNDDFVLLKAHRQN